MNPLILLGVILVAQDLAPVRCPKNGPLSEADLTSLTSNAAFPKPRVIQFIDQCGVSFQLTPQVRDRLKRAGATDEAVAHVEKKAPKPAPPTARAPSTLQPAVAQPVEVKELDTEALKLRAELTLWETIKDGTSVELFDDYSRNIPKDNSQRPPAFDPVN